MTDTKDDTAGQMNGDEPISDEKYQQALDEMRGMNRAVPKMHPEDIEIPAFDGQGRIDGGRQMDNTKQEISDANEK